MTTFDERFYKALPNTMVGYKNRTVADFLHHLYRNYGQITSTMITDLEAKMSALLNPAAPIKDLFAQISNRQDLPVAAGMPYLDIQLLQEHFTTAHRELHQLQTAARQSGNTTNNAMYIKQEDGMQHRTVEALANLTDATTSDCAAVVNLSESNTKLANQVIDMANQLKKKDSDMDAMRKSINDLTKALRELRQGANTSAGLGLAQGTRKYCCRSHGTTTGPWHTGKNCCTKKDGHKKEATINNKMDDSTEVPRIRTD
eukprot:13673805-Ditylum_brightwellii.AAC.1